MTDGIDEEEIYRVEGYVSGSEGRTKVMTEPLESRGTATGVSLGLEIRGWEDTEIVELEAGDHD